MDYIYIHRWISRNPWVESARYLLSEGRHVKSKSRSYWSLIGRLEIGWTTPQHALSGVCCTYQWSYGWSSSSCRYSIARCWSMFLHHSLSLFKFRLRRWRVVFSPGRWGTKNCANDPSTWRLGGHLPSSLVTPGESCKARHQTTSQNLGLVQFWWQFCYL